MKTIKTHKTLALKDGMIIVEGTPLIFLGSSDLPTVGRFECNGRELKLRYRNVIKAPSMKSLERWSNDSVCKSVFGGKCEPDGYCEKGGPSWPLAMGLI